MVPFFLSGARGAITPSELVAEAERSRMARRPPRCLVPAFAERVEFESFWLGRPAFAYIYIRRV